MTQNFSRLHVTLGPPSTLQENLDSDSWGIDHRSPSRWASGHSPNTAQDSSCWDPRMSGTSSRKRSRCPGASTDGTQGRLCSQTRLEHAEGSQVSSEGSQPRATMPLKRISLLATGHPAWGLRGLMLCGLQSRQVRSTPQLAQIKAPTVQREIS